MSGGKIQAELVSNREEILQLRQYLAEYRKKYAQLNRANNELNKRICSLEKEQDINRSKILAYESEKLKNTVTDSSKRRKRKSLTDLKDPKTKRKRLDEYRRQLVQLITDLFPDCERAQVTVSVAGKPINFNWNNSDFTNSDSCPSSQESADHNYSACRRQSAECETQSSSCFDLAKILNADGEYLTRHKRGIIHVLDTFRISKHAYHELVMQSRGHLPPVGQILKERQVMSDTVPYTKHPSVSCYSHPKE